MVSGWQTNPLSYDCQAARERSRLRGDRDSGVEAAETGESDAQARETEGRARDETVGVAQYVVAPPYRAEKVVSTEVITLNRVSR